MLKSPLISNNGRTSRRILIIGWDAADWNLMMPLVEKGLMPTLKGLMDRGSWGKIATLNPPYSPMLWSSVATGKTPDKHGVLNFVEPDPELGGIRPVTVTSRRSKALWNILTQEGLKSNVVSWWPTQPAEPILGNMVSDEFHKVVGTLDEEWPVKKYSTHPPELAEELAQYRVHPYELTGAHLLPFVKDAAKVDGDESKMLQNMARIIADCASVQAATTYLMKQDDWDLTACYFDGIDHFCHGFVKFHPPKMDGLSDEMYERYKEVVTSGYRFHDMMLERQLKLAGPDTTVILLSDHGFHSDHLRLRRIPKFNAGPALEHAPYGAIVMAGPGIKQGQQVFGASLLDIAPTVLSLLGLPVGQDMDGKVLSQVLDLKENPRSIPSWEDVEGESGMHPPHLQQDPTEAAAALQQLIALGYVEDPGEDKNKAAEIAGRDIRFNLAQVHKGKQEFKKAHDILEALCEDAPTEMRYAVELLAAKLRLRKFKEARPILEKIRTENKTGLVNLPLLEAKLLLGENKPLQALHHLQEVEKRRARMPNLHLELGRVYLAIHRFEKAERAFRIAKEVDPQSAEAAQGIAEALLRRGEFEAAAQMAFEATSLLFHFPKAHHVLGQALEGLGMIEEAMGAYRVTLNLAPSHLRAMKRLINLAQSQSVEVPDAEALSKRFRKQIKGEITIVSGLPHSGQEALMKVLAERGFPTVDYDGEDELALARRIKQDPDFLLSLDGKIISVPLTALKVLPVGYLYRIIMLNRDFTEVLKAQSAADGKAGAFPVKANEVFQRELDRIEAWEKAEPHVQTLHFDYDQIDAEADVVVARISDFADLRASLHE